MCAISGFFDRKNRTPEPQAVLGSMLERLSHRGPDEKGVYHAPGIGLGHARLRIMDPKGGHQPMADESGRIQVVCAGEIFNHSELRKELEGKGHRFKTASDSEVVVHLYEEEGIACLKRLNGQFAIAIWDGSRKELYLSRDRFGILPLYYSLDRDRLIFASEMKAILAYPGVAREMNPSALDQLFTFWTTVPPDTLLRGILELRPGHYLRVSRDSAEEKRYWDMSFPPEGGTGKMDEAACLERLDALLTDAVRLRLKADVPVGLYLSGGLDSGVIAALAAKLSPRELRAFSVQFENKAYDERGLQEELVRKLQLGHSSMTYRDGDAADFFSQLLWHAEKPVLRTGPAPLYRLAQLVRQKEVTCVLAGEGADEFFLGYGIFKETKVRQFWSRNKDSQWRPRLLNELYPYLPLVRNQGNGYLKKVFGHRLEENNHPFYSHLVRWKQTGLIKNFYSAGTQSLLRGYDAVHDLDVRMNPAMRRWDPVARSQYLESLLFLNGYLLSSQGDRMAMAHGVEVRYPYLDHRLVEFLNQIPASLKMRGLHEKRLLKRLAARVLPQKVVAQPKRPYRAPALPIAAVKRKRELWNLLSTNEIERKGYFDPAKVDSLLKKLENTSSPASEVDSMAFLGILSVQLFDEIFIKNKGDCPRRGLSPVGELGGTVPAGRR